MSQCTSTTIIHPPTPDSPALQPCATLASSSVCTLGPDNLSKAHPAYPIYVCIVNRKMYSPKRAQGPWAGWWMFCIAWTVRFCVDAQDRRGSILPVG
jgi:hypothetical protein